LVTVVVGGHLYKGAVCDEAVDYGTKGLHLCGRDVTAQIMGSVMSNPAMHRKCSEE